MKLSLFTRSLLSISVLSGAFFTSTTQAVEIPGDNINYTASTIRIQYLSAPGANTDLGCFSESASLIYKSLTEIGITSLDGISSVVSGDSNACFQKAGEYRILLLLVDTAGNAIAYPSGLPVPLSPAQVADPDNAYTITITPSIPVIDPSAPQGGTEVTEFENDPDGPGGSAPVTGGNCDISSDGVSNCMVEVVFRDAFGNMVTQLDSVSDVSVYLGISPGTKDDDIDIDGLFGPVSSGTELDASSAFNGANSKNIFLQQVFAGGTGANGDNLETLLNDGSQPAVTGVTMITPGHFQFMVRSYVPTMKLLDENDPSAGSGVYAQPLSFDLAFPPIDANGNLGATKQRWGGLVNGDFVFRPIADAAPTISPTTITWGTVLGSIQTVLNGATEYLLYTPFSQYVLKEKFDDGSGGTDVRSYEQPMTDTSLVGVGDDEGPFFELISSGVGSSLPSSVGVGSQVQYTNNNSTTIRHMSYPSGFTVSDCSGYTGFEECYPFVPGGSARFIGADIEGSIQGEQSKVNIYNVDDAANSFGQAASYAGEVNNDAIRDDLLQQVERATKSPNADAVVASNNTSPVQFSSFASKFNNHDVVIVNGSVRFTTANQLPTGQKTLIVVNGNVFVEGNQSYGSATDSFGVIVYNTDQTRVDGNAPLTGNVFVHENVRGLSGNFYLDGSFMSVNNSQYAGLRNGSDSVNDLVYVDQTKQFVLTGVLWSNNTLGGSFSDIDNPGLFRSPWSLAQITEQDITKKFDLHFFRRYDATNTGDCSNVTGSCDVNKNATVIRLDRKIGYEQTAPPIFKSIQSLVR